MSNVITALVAKISMDTKDVSAGSAQVRKDAATVSRVFREMETDTDKLERKLRALYAQKQRGSISAEQYARALHHLGQKQVEAANKARQAELAERNLANQHKVSSKMVGGLGNAFSFLSPQVLAASAAMGVFYGSVRFLQNSIKLAASLEEINVRFEVMTGNAKDAEELVSSMRKLANTTSLTFSGLQKNAQTMLAFGVATENVIPVLQQIGDITSGDAERMQSLTLAFSQMSSAGKLMGQDLLQMINAGFNPLQEISEKTGVSIAELRKRMEAGAISADLVNAAFESATSAGGRFQGMLEKSKNTFSGQMRQLNSDIEVLTTAIGEELLPTVKELVSSFSGLASSENIAFIREMTYLLTATNKLAFDPLNTLMDALERYGLIDPVEQMESVASGAAKATSKIVDSEEKMRQMLNSAKSDAFREMTEEFEKQIELLELGEKAFERKQMYAKGFSAEQINQIEAQKEYIAQQQALIEKEKEAEKERKRQAEERTKMMDDAMKRGAELMQRHSPVKQVEKQLADLQVLLVANAIDQSTFFKERNKILKQSLSRDAMPEASAIEVGSAEFVKMVAGQMNQEVDAQIQKMEEQRLLQAAQLAATKETNRRLQEMGIMKRIVP